MSLPGTIFPTDYGWYDFLNQRGELEEVNFWTPSAHWAFKAPEFSPFLFKLKSPHNAICGFGFFARYAALHDWFAWECFHDANGCASLDDLRARIAKIRRGIDFRGSAGPTVIGCIVLVNVSFFDRNQWIKQPADWPAPNLRGKRYDLAVGEGARVWEACLERVQQARASATGPIPAIVSESRPRYGNPVLVRPRLGQGAFRVSVTEAYERACAVTREHSLPVLEAAHIQPFAKEGPHEVCNGLLLRADLHRLFEQGYVTVTPDQHLEVSQRLKTDYENGRTYYPLHGTKLWVPSTDRERPDGELLKWHNDHVFLS